MPRSRRSRNVLVPIGLSITAAVVGLGLYFWLGDGSKKQTSTSSAPPPSDPIRQNQQPIEHNRTTEVEDESIQDPQPKPRPNPINPGQKEKIVVVVREDSLELLWNLPTPLDMSTVNVFILVHSPQSGVNLERVYGFVGELLPKNYPREYVMPYTVEEALLPLLRHLAPKAVYMDESLVGKDGASVSGLLEGNWVGAVVVAVGQGSGLGDGWRQSVQKFGRRCAIIERSGVKGDWAGRVG